MQSLRRTLTAISATDEAGEPWTLELGNASSCGEFFSTPLKDLKIPGLDDVEPFEAGGGVSCRRPIIDEARSGGGGSEHETRNPGESQIFDRRFVHKNNLKLIPRGRASAV